MMKLPTTMLLLALASTRADAQINAGAQNPEPGLPFTMTQVATFNLPWRIAFSPDGQYLCLTVGDRQRMTPAQDPNQELGKILRLTLDGKPAPGNPMAGKTGAATVSLIDPPRDTEAAKTAAVVRTYDYPG